MFERYALPAQDPPAQELDNETALNSKLRADCLCWAIGLPRHHGNTLLVTWPPATVYFIRQRYFVLGMVASGLKGYATAPGAHLSLSPGASGHSALKNLKQLRSFLAAYIAISAVLRSASAVSPCCG